MLITEPCFVGVLDHSRFVIRVGLDEAHNGAAHSMVSIVRAPIYPANCDLPRYESRIVNRES